LDLLVNGKLVVELKAVEALAPIHVAQILSYLKATRIHLGLLISFNVTLLRRGIRRVIYST
jgi:GxxExxY protein